MAAPPAFGTGGLVGGAVEGEEPPLQSPDNAASSAEGAAAAAPPVASAAAVAAAAAAAANQDVEAEVGSLFQRVFHGGSSGVETTLVRLQSLAAHPPLSAERRILPRFLSLFFAETRHFPRYPLRELSQAAVLLGQLLQRGICAAEDFSLRVALRCVAEAIKKGPPSKMFLFGVAALEQFLAQLPQFPEFAYTLLQLQPQLLLHRHYAEYAEKVVAALPRPFLQQLKLSPQQLAGIPLPPPPVIGMQGSSSGVVVPGSMALRMQSERVPKTMELFQQQQQMAAAAATPGSGVSSGVEQLAAESPPSGEDSAKAVAAASVASSAGSAASSGAAGSAGSARSGAGGNFAWGGVSAAALQASAEGQAESLLSEEELFRDVAHPPQWLADQASAVCNSLCQANVREKAIRFRAQLDAAYVPWFALYLVRSRVVKEPNHHKTYIEFIDALQQLPPPSSETGNSSGADHQQGAAGTTARESPQQQLPVVEAVISSSYECTKILLRSVEEAKDSSTYRTLLKNLGKWLGAITIARNKPLKSKHIDLKKLLLSALRDGCLVAILPFCCKVLEGIEGSRTFRLPNPWTAAILSLLAALHSLPNLKTNLLFDIEILFKNLEINIADFAARRAMVGLALEGIRPNSGDFAAQPQQRPSPASAEIPSGTTGADRGRASATAQPSSAPGVGMVSAAAHQQPQNAGLSAFSPEERARLAVLPGGPAQRFSTAGAGSAGGPSGAAAAGLSGYETQQQLPQMRLLDAVAAAAAARGGGAGAGASSLGAAAQTLGLAGADHLAAGAPAPTQTQQPLHAIAAGASAAQQQNARRLAGVAEGLSPDQQPSAGPSSALPSWVANSAAGGAAATGAESACLANVQNYVRVSSALALFSMQPSLKAFIPIAVDRAVREIVSAVVERSVSISCVTTRELVLKDLAFEGEEALVKRAAHLMAAALAGSLALVTCREPLRVALIQHLRSLLQPAASKEAADQALLEQVVQVVCADNLEVGCQLVEQVVMEKVLREIEVVLQPAFLARKHARERGVQFVDSNYVNNAGAWGYSLPPVLKLRPGLSAKQLQVYKDFMQLTPLRRIQVNAAAAAAQQQQQMPLKPQMPPAQQQQAVTRQQQQQPHQQTPPVVAQQQPPRVGVAGGPLTPTNKSVSVRSGSSGRVSGAPPPPPAPFQLALQTLGCLEPLAVPAAGSLNAAGVILKMDAALSRLSEAIKALFLCPPVLPSNPNCCDQVYIVPGCRAVALPLPKCTSAAVRVVASLPSDSELSMVLRSCQAIAASAANPSEVVPQLAQRILKTALEGAGCQQPRPAHAPIKGVDLITLHLEVFFYLLATLPGGEAEVANFASEVLSMTLSTAAASAASPGPRKSSVNVAAAIVRYKLVAASDVDATLAAMFRNSAAAGAAALNNNNPTPSNNANNAAPGAGGAGAAASAGGAGPKTGGVEFGLAVLQLLLQQRAAQPSQWTLSRSALAELRLPKCQQRRPQMPSPSQQLLDARDKILEAFAAEEARGGVDDKLVVSLLDLWGPTGCFNPTPIVRALPAVPPCTPQQQQTAQSFLRDWILLCCGSSGGGPAAAERSFMVRATYFQKISQHGLLRMDEETDRFFAAALSLAVDASLEPLQQEALFRRQLREQQQQQQQQQQRLAEDSPAAAATQNVVEETGAGAGPASSASNINSGGSLLVPPQLQYVPIDCFCQMITGMMALVDPAQIAPVTILQRGLGVICRVIHKRAAESSGPVASGVSSGTSSSVSSVGGEEASLAQQLGGSSQRPFFRLLRLLLEETVVVAEARGLEQQAALCLHAIADHLVLLSPLRVPSFSFAWLELFGCRAFISRAAKQRRYWACLGRLMKELFAFLRPFLAAERLTPAVRRLYRATLRLLLLLLHDFPEFLCEHHVALCTQLPLNCVQMRNLVLSAFPRSMKLPDPFLPTDLAMLPEVQTQPRVLFPASLLLLTAGVKPLLDRYATERDPSLLQAVLPLLRVRNACSRQQQQQQQQHSQGGMEGALPGDAEEDEGAYDVTVLNALVMYIGTALHSSASMASLASSPAVCASPLHRGEVESSGTAAEAAVSTPGGAHQNPSGSVSQSTESGGVCGEVLLHLTRALDMEGRYLLLSAVANQLRFPSSHTRDFSALMLWLFAECRDSRTQEQITRVLLERLLVHRPHAWGLAITFIELMKNPRFDFWSCAFVKAVPEVEKLFKSVAVRCVEQTHSQQQQQQQTAR